MPFANRMNPGCRCCHVGSPPVTVCLEAVACSDETAPDTTFTLTDDLGHSVSPSSSGDTWACFPTEGGRHYTACAMPADGWAASGCVTFLGPHFGRIAFSVYRDPLEIRIEPSSTTCDGGKFPADTLTWASACPFTVKPNGVDRPGYYGSAEHTTSYPPRDFGPYSICNSIVDVGGDTLYGQYDGQSFYYFIPATAPGITGTGPYLLYQVQTNGGFPGLVFSGQEVSRNPCPFPWRNTHPNICGGVASPECAEFSPAECECFSDLCFQPTIPGNPCPGIGLDEFYIDWSIPE